MKAELQPILDNATGNAYNYQNKHLHITGYKFVGGNNTVLFTNNGPKNLYNTEVKAFLEELGEPIGKTSVAVQPKANGPSASNKLVTIEPNRENVEMKNVLMETLNKLKADPSYIPQASSICEVVGQMVAIQKNELQMLGLINKFR